MLVFAKQRSRRLRAKNSCTSLVLSYNRRGFKFERIGQVILILSAVMWAVPNLVRGADRQFPLAIDQGAVDFGDVTVGHTANRSLRLSNPTTQSVQLTVDSDCQCLSPRLKSSEVQAAGETPLEIHLDTCKGSVGEVRRHVYVRMKSPPETLAVPIRYRVRESVFAEPEVVSLGLFEESSTPVAVTIASLNDQPVEIIRAVSDNPAIAVEVVQARIERLKTGEVSIRASGELPIGPIGATVVVETAHPTCPRIRIGVTGERTQGLTLDSAALNTARTLFKAKSSHTLRIIERKGSRVRGLHSSSPSIQIQSVKREREASEVIFAFDPNLPLGSVLGLITLEVEDPQPRRVALRCSGQFVVSDDPIDAAPGGVALTKRPCVSTADAQQNRTTSK